MDEPPDELPGATFSHRLLAFVVDSALFSGGFAATAIALQASGNEGRLRPALLLWAAAWLAYHAACIALWGRTLGKRLASLRVVDPEGNIPGPFASCLRAAGYLLSGVPVYAGFLWALRSDGLAWHDILADTRVVEDGSMSPRARTAASALGWGLGGLVALAWFAFVVVGPSLARMKLLAHGRTGIKGLAYLEERYAQRHGGEYAADLKSLLDDSAEGTEIAKALPFHLDPASVSIVVGPGSYVLEANALDIPPTRLRFEGPAEGAKR